MHECPFFTSFEAAVCEQLFQVEFRAVAKPNVTLPSEERGPPCGVTV